MFQSRVVLLQAKRVDAIGKVILPAFGHNSGGGLCHRIKQTRVEKVRLLGVKSAMGVVV